MLFKRASIPVNSWIFYQVFPLYGDRIDNLNPLKIITQLQQSRCFSPWYKNTIVSKQVGQVNLVNIPKKWRTNRRIVNLDEWIETYRLRKNHSCINGGWKGYILPAFDDITIKCGDRIQHVRRNRQIRMKEIKLLRHALEIKERDLLPRVKVAVKKSARYSLLKSGLSGWDYS